MILYKKIIVIVSLIFSITVSSFAQKTHIHGKVPEYANCELEFLIYTDFISKTEKTLANCKVDENGEFFVNVDIKETKYVFLHLGIYQAFIFIEPNKDYELLLPEKKEKTTAEKLNPYFKEIKYHLGIVNSSESELNYVLAYFNHEYNKMSNESAYAVYTKDVGLNVDEVVAKLDSNFSNYKNKYFLNYKKYKIAYFRHLSYQYKTKSISNTYYLNKDVLYSNPAYMELFNQVYDEYL
ncbi:MAG: hypothetical protein U9R54_05740 [Bacteroidota bacterium]|nr:hypothetical protein [Bacteroidota bacterium]